MNQTERMIDRIKNVEKFNDIAYLCEDFQSFVDEVQETENLFCAPDEIDDVMYTMSEQYGYAEAYDTMNTHCGEYGERPLSLGERKYF